MQIMHETYLYPKKILRGDNHDFFCMICMICMIYEFLVFMKSVIYARVSSVEQVSGYSIEAQIDQCRAWANEQGYNVARVYIEPGRSARTDDRPVFQRMIKNVCAGEAGAVVVHKVDRFARNLLDLLRYKRQLRDEGVRLLSASEEFLNGDSPENDLAIKIMGAVAEYVAWNIGQEAVKGQDAKAKSGSWPGSVVPLGYERIGQGRGSTIDICPDYGEIIKTAYNEFSSGNYTIRQWVAEAKKRGYRSRQGNVISSTTWHNVFRSVFYLGRFDWKGEIYDGDHPSLIDEETWQTVQDVLEARGSGGSQQRHFWLLRGLLWSEVHSRPMSGSLVYGRWGGCYAYYRAKGRRNDHEHNIRADEAEKQAVDLLATIRADGQTLTAPDDLRLALLSATHCGAVYAHLITARARRDFLKLIFLTHGLHVNAAGVVSVYGLRPGFMEMLNDDLERIY